LSEDIFGDLLVGDADRNKNQSLPRSSGLDSSLQFETFVEGDENISASHAARFAANEPGKKYNPVYIYGDSSLGKTHLLHSIGNKCAQMGKNTIYVPSESFLNDFVFSISSNGMKKFREKYRTCDVLLVDDLQTICSAQKTQEELFHTFNTIINRGGQLVFAADRSPEELPGIDDRLRSRFVWGLTTKVYPLGPELKKRIISDKAEAAGISLDEDVMEHMLNATGNNVRQVMGALNILKASMDLGKYQNTLEAARSILVYKKTVHRTPNDIMKITAKHYGISVADMKGRSRKQRYVGPRQMAALLMKNSKYSLSEIGDAMGGRDHSTVAHSIKKVRGKIEGDLDARAHFAGLEAECR
jgi:chromosomal replication initiator protein